MKQPDEQCFQCGLPLSASSVLTRELDGTKIALCSSTCVTTFERISSAGLSDFYKHREPSTKKNDSADPDTGITDWSSYERPAVQREFVANNPDGSLTAQLLVQGVHCAACTWLIEAALSKLDGVVSIAVNPITTRGELRWHPDKCSLADLLKTIAELGYQPIPFTDNEAQLAVEQTRRLALRRLLVAGLGMMQVSSYAIAMYAGAFQGMDPQIQEFFRLISLLVATPIVIYSGAPFFSGAWRSLQARLLNMDVPVALAIGAAWSASVWNTFTGSGEVYFDSATMFVFFLSGTRYLEAAGRQRALNLTNALSQHIPCTTTRLVNGQAEQVGVMELETGDIVLVQTGVAFPADGFLLDTDARIDESMLTGESVPVKRLCGDAIAAGTLNLESATRISVDKIGADTVLAQIGRLVTQAGEEKPKLIQLTDRIASIFVAAVLLLTAASSIYWWSVDPDRAFEIVLAVLVVTCPCALALATPAAFTVATSSLARRGFLIRRGGALPAMATVTHALFDKTGTLTSNSLSIESVRLFAELSEADATAVAAALESHSAHPLARAFRHSASLDTASNVHEYTGAGLEGMVNDVRYRLGSPAFVTAELACEPHTLEAAPDARRCIYLANEDGVLARFDITEELRSGAAAMVQALRRQDISTSIASGDQEAPVAKLAHRIGTTDWQSEMRPEDKLKLLQQLQAEGAVVAAIGDGINDSPVLAGAGVSIAMGSGTSIAQHSADCVWLGNNFNEFAEVFRIARATMRVVKQNLTWALCYNGIAIPLAVSGQLAPWMAALGMSLSSLLVMLNALRLGMHKPETVAQESTGSCCAKQPEPAT